MEKSVKIRLRFTPSDTERPFVHLLATRFGLVFSILQADISPDKGGRMVLDLSGEEAAIEDALKFTIEQGFKKGLKSCDNAHIPNSTTKQWKAPSPDVPYMPGSKG